MILPKVDESSSQSFMNLSVHLERGLGKKLSIVSMRIMTHKKRVSLFIDSELLDSAGAYGLNLSKFMTSCLKVWRENPSFILNAEQQKFRMDRSGFEPETSCLRSRRSTADLPAR